MAAEAIKRKDDRSVFESLALGALNHHEKDPEFQRLLLHSALEKHQLAEMFLQRVCASRLRVSRRYIPRATDATELSSKSIRRSWCVALSAW
jgi:hypothetical protein